VPDDAVELVTITVNGYELEVPKGQLVIDAAEQAGIWIPRFCYHPRMRPVGMCRMCLVDIDTGRGPALQPSCMIQASDGMVVDTESPATKKAQDGVLEFLLINHPIDCPVCDKGGECPLQDNTYAYGPGESRFVEEKRHYAKPISISPLVQLDRERCILCDRCTRFAYEVAGDPLISFVGRGDHTQVNTFPDHPFSSYFSGNTVQICPVGALLAVPYRFKARPWDLEKAESTCTTCSVGCRISVESSRNRVLRRGGVDLDPVNWGWLCDKGRFTYEAVESEGRLGEPLCRDGDSLVPVRWGEALTSTVEALRVPPDRIGFIGGARLTNEAAYAWTKLAKGVLGTDNVDCQLGDGLPPEVVFGLPRATIDEAFAEGGTVLLLAPDLKEEVPVLFLRLRDAVKNHGVQVVELSPIRTSVTKLAAASLRYRPGEAGLVARTLAGLAGGGAPLDGDADAARALLTGAERLTIVLGRPSLAEGESTIVDAVAALTEAFPDARVLSVLRRANVHGALDMGMSPGVLPGHVTLEDGRDWFARAWGSVPAARGMDTAAMLTAAAEGRLDTLVLLGADPLDDFPDHALADRALARVRHVVAVDTHRNPSVERANVVLAAAGPSETDGTTTNLEGRVLTVARKVTAPGTARADWEIAAELAHRLGRDLGIESVEDAWSEVERLAPSFVGITPELVRWGASRDGVVMPLTDEELAELEGARVTIAGRRPAAATAESEAAEEAEAEAAEEGEAAGESEGEPAAPGESVVAAARRDQPPQLRFSPPASPTELPGIDAYGFRLVATRTLYDRGTLVLHSPSLAKLPTPASLRMHPQDLGRLGLDTGATVRVTAPAGRSAVLEAVADDAVPRGVVAMHVNHDGADPASLIDITSPVTNVKVDAS
jgi:NADH-quinone oxidoreductase subunit G